MGFLRRLLGGPTAANAPASADPAPEDPADLAVDADEAAYERALLEGEQARLDDLAQRQLRYARFAWQPPAQGGDRRADDQDTHR